MTHAMTVVDEPDDWEDWDEPESDYVPPKATVNPWLQEEFAEVLPRLIRLCHPDRHSNSINSTEVSQWLNKQKQIIQG